MRIEQSEIIVFSGLTLNKQQIRDYLPSSIYLPPAVQGDLYQAYKTFKPKVIALVDGLFEVEPSVWHKEILYLLSQNVSVYGSSSMGALRAAELHAFGMKGIGKIFNDYLTGTLEDDDEVAVFYGPEEIGYPALSDAMVSIRATVEKAVLARVVDKEISAAIIQTAKSLFYKERTYEKTFSILKLSDTESKTILSWIRDKKIDLKQSDAIELMKTLSKLEEAPIFESSFHFNRTIFWENSSL